MPKRDRKASEAAPATTEETPTLSPEQDYYNRLLYQCRKDLAKQLKICKSFECQKLIRKIKSLSEDNDKPQTSNPQLQQQYETVKQLSLEPVLDEACRRLGLLQLNPQGYEALQQSAADSSNSKWTEKLLQHKRMQESMEKWSAQATEFTKWCLKRQEREQIDRVDGDPSHHDSKRRKKQANDKRQDAKLAVSDHGDVASSLFVQLGAGDPLLASAQHTKKNRPGQRARKAKAAAIQAKEKGLPAPEKSLNWRERKATTAKTDSDSHSKHDSTKDEKSKSHSSENQQHAQSSAKAEKLHPSWEAQKSKKDGIVAFQGKKITFD